ncbi:MAG: tetratricopeptide repeat protein [Candidatus Omnitrophica bacterium]|nr:tetratricopeptide repeat protein [Candidatus Omnitrophota bacterium]
MTPDEMSAPDPAPRRPAAGLWWSWLVGMLVVAGVAGAGWAWFRVSRYVASARAREAVARASLRDLQQRSQALQGQQESLQTQNKELQVHLEMLNSQENKMEEDYAALETTRQALAQERDHLLEQIKQRQADQQVLAEERDKLEKVLQATTQASRELREQVEPLQQELAQLKSSQEQAVAERNTLEQEVVALQKGTREKDLRKQVDSQRRELVAVGRALQASRSEAKEATERAARVQADLNATQQQYEELKNRHAEIMSRNLVLKSEAAKVPRDINRLARQHEQLRKETSSMHYNLGLMFTRNKQWARAEKEFRKVLELSPDEADAYYNLGVIYAEHLTNRDKALTHFRKYLDLKPHAQDANWVRSYIATWQAWDGKERLE